MKNSIALPEFLGLPYLPYLDHTHTTHTKGSVGHVGQRAAHGFRLRKVGQVGQSLEAAELASERCAQPRLTGSGIAQPQVGQARQNSIRGTTEDGMSVVVGSGGFT